MGSLKAESVYLFCRQSISPSLGFLLHPHVCSSYEVFVLTQFFHLYPSSRPVKTTTTKHHVAAYRHVALRPPTTYLHISRQLKLRFPPPNFSPLQRQPHQTPPASHHPATSPHLTTSYLDSTVYHNLPTTSPSNIYFSSNH